MPVIGIAFPFQGSFGGNGSIDSSSSCKKLAEVLHQTKPALYKDANHKPEMAYALDDFTAMCGFRSAEEIASNLHECIYLRTLIGETGIEFSIYSIQCAQNLNKLSSLIPT